MSWKIARVASGVEREGEQELAVGGATHPGPLDAWGFPRVKCSPKGETTVVWHCAWPLLLLVLILLQISQKCRILLFQFLLSRKSYCDEWSFLSPEIDELCKHLISSFSDVISKQPNMCHALNSTPVLPAIID